MKYLKFELRKFIVDRKNLAMLVILSILMIGGAIQWDFQRQTDNNYIESLQVQSKQKTMENSEALYFADENNLSQEERQKLLAENDIENKKNQALDARDFNKYYDLVYEQDKQRLGDPKKENKSDIFEPNTAADPKDEMTYIELVKSRGLDFELQAENQRHAFGELVTSFSKIFSSLWLIGFAIILSVSLAAIFENKEERVYHSLQVTSARLIWTKLFSSISTAFIWLLSLSGIFLIIFGVKNGFGSPNYPAYLVNPPSMSSLLNPLADHRRTVANLAISSGSVILITLLYALIIFFFIAALGMFLSMLTKSSLVVITIIAIFIQGFDYIKEQPWLQDLRKFIPMSYLDPVNLLKNPSDLFGKNSLTIGAVYLLVLGLLFLISSQIMYKNYRIRRI
ncbi:MAG: hypothetical protein LBV19_06750 [Streptococcaceae bacterium]|jgi:ABC-2 type transport system permease protein|nr:hypothetical protein [Streptococcaceae bacterium]